MAIIRRRPRGPQGPPLPANAAAGDRAAEDGLARPRRRRDPATLHQGGAPRAAQSIGGSGPHGRLCKYKSAAAAALLLRPSTPFRERRASGTAPGSSRPKMEFASVPTGNRACLAKTRHSMPLCRSSGSPGALSRLSSALSLRLFGPVLDPPACIRDVVQQTQPTTRGKPLVRDAIAPPSAASLLSVRALFELPDRLSTCRRPVTPARRGSRHPRACFSTRSLVPQTLGDLLDAHRGRALEFVVLPVQMIERRLA